MFRYKTLYIVQRYIKKLSQRKKIYFFSFLFKISGCVFAQFK